MKKIVIASCLVLFSFYNVKAQEKLSRKETRELKKKKAIEALESAILTAKFRFVADKMFASSVNASGAKGGILFLRNDRGEFMEYWWINKEGEKVMVSTEFDVEKLNTFGTFNSGHITLSFEANIKGKLWSFQFTTKPSGKSHLVLKSSYGYYIKYNGRVSKL